MNGIIAKLLADATAPLMTDLTLVKQQVGVAPDAPTVPTVDARLLALRTDVTGQATLIGPRMTNRSSALRLDAFEAALALLDSKVTTLTDALAAQYASLAPRLEIGEANTRLSLANDALNAAAAQSADAKAAAAISKAEAADAKAVAARLVADAALALAQADQVGTAEAKAAATTAQAAADKAQATASDAAALAAADKVAAAEARALAAEAKTTALAAQATADKLAARFRGKLVATPAITLAVNGSTSVPVLWDTPFADANYEIELTPQGTSLLGVRLSYTSKTAAGFSLLLTNLGALSLAIAAGVVDATALHN